MTERTAAEQLADRYGQAPSGLLWCLVHGTSFVRFCAGCGLERGVPVAETGAELARARPAHLHQWDGAPCARHGVHCSCGEPYCTHSADLSRPCALDAPTDPVARLLARIDRAVAPRREVLAERHRLVPQLCQGATCACRPLAEKYAAGLLPPDLCSCPMSLRMNGEHAAGCEARHA